jgi:hypothetical protein
MNGMKRTEKTQKDKGPRLFPWLSDKSQDHTELREVVLLSHMELSARNNRNRKKEDIYIEKKIKVLFF